MPFFLLALLLISLWPNPAFSIATICRTVERVAQETGVLQEAHTPDNALKYADPLFLRKKIEAGDLFEGKYEILGHLVTGGEANVFLARTLPIGPESKEVILRNSSVDESVKQQKFIARARKQPNGHLIVEAEQIGTALVMPHETGALDLYEAMKKPLTVENAKSYLTQLAYGIKAIHDAGIVHRDIKPSNVLILPNGEIRILDFGAAVNRDSPPVPLEGTPSYFPPEVARMESVRPTRRQDTFAWQRVAEEISDRLKKEESPANSQAVQILGKLSARDRKFKSADDVIEALSAEWP